MVTRAATGTIDHVAIEVADFDARIEWMSRHLGLEVRRIGRLGADPTRRIAMLADRRGVKLEIVEAPTGTPAGRPDVVRHLAMAVDDVESSEAALREAGAAPVREPHRFEPARSTTAVVRPPLGIDVQLVRYDDDSPDR